MLWLLIVLLLGGATLCVAMIRGAWRDGALVYWVANRKYVTRRADDPAGFRFAMAALAVSAVVMAGVAIGLIRAP